MTQEEIIEMAVTAGIVPWTKHEHIGGNNFSATDEGLDGDIVSLIQFAKMVDAKATAREREACAELIADWGKVNWNIWDCAMAIRARGEA